MAGGRRAGDLERAERVNAAVELVESGVGAADAARTLAKRFAVSTRQARRYVDRAGRSGRGEAPEATVVVTVVTRNLAIGVVVGVLVAMTLFARRVAHLTETNREVTEDEDGNAVALYRVSGALFFASSNDLYTQFHYVDDPERVVIDLSDSDIWDASTVASLDAISTKYERKGKRVRIVGLNAASADRHGRLSGQLDTH